MFGGVHAILGWAQNISVGPTAKFSRYLRNWWQDTTCYTSTAFLSTGIEDNPQSPFQYPAVAVAVGPTGNRYKYLFEKWHRAEEYAAPTGAAMIVWCMPYFNDPNEGLFWVEE